MYIVALPIDMPEAAQAVDSVVSGPRVPNRIDTSAAPMLAISAVTQNGLSRSGPAENSFSCAISWVIRPPMPVPIEQPIRSPSASMSMPECSIASPAAFTAICANRSVLRIVRLSMNRLGSNSLISPPMSTQSSGIVTASTFETPERPLRIASHVSAAFRPHGVIAPNPVTTTASSLSLMLPALRRPPARHR